MGMTKFPHFVNLSTLTSLERRAAAHWAIEQFGSKGVDIWQLGPNEEPGFWFAREKDAALFILKWV